MEIVVKHPRLVDVSLKKRAQAARVSVRHGADPELALSFVLWPDKTDEFFQAIIDRNVAPLHRAA